jgi:hypothetical protein
MLPKAISSNKCEGFIVLVSTMDIFFPTMISYSAKLPFVKIETSTKNANPVWNELTHLL